MEPRGSRSRRGWLALGAVLLLAAAGLGYWALSTGVPAPAPPGGEPAGAAPPGEPVDRGVSVSKPPATPDSAGEPPANEPPKAVEVVREVVADRLEVPWGMAFTPDGDLFFTERPGRVRLLTGLDGDSPRLHTVAVLEDTAAVGEGGLLGLALHPDFPDQPLVYVYQTYRGRGGLRNRVLAFRFDGEARRLVDRRVILDGIPGHTIHDGGQLAFGPDGKLYVTTGDAGVARAAQDPEVLQGKILRLEPDGMIPGDNPLGSDIPAYSYGHRNPEGLAFSPDGRLFATEHGSDGLDELNRIEAGRNYGWPRVRGADHGDYAAPVRVYEHLPPAGAAFYDGPIAQWRGSIFFGSLGFTKETGRQLRRIRFADADGQRVAEEEALFRNEYGRIRAVAAGPDGCLYFGTSNRDGRGDPAPEDDRIIRLCARK